MSIFFGPPHLGFHCETTPDLPSQMQILLPCPVQEPSAIRGRKGTPFRHWDMPPGLTEDERHRLRMLYLQKEQDILVLHSTPNWAWKAAEHFGLPYYSFLSKTHRILSRRPPLFDHRDFGQQRKPSQFVEPPQSANNQFGGLAKG